MPAFPTDALTQHPLDFELARSGGIALYLRNDVLASAEGKLDDLGYAKARLDASKWTCESRLHEDVATALGFPGYYGNNMDALADCLGDVASGDYGWDVNSTGLAVIIEGFGSFARREPGLADALLDTLTRTSSEAMLFGHRLLWLLHVDDPDFRMGPVGAVTVSWNGREWLDATRR